MFLRQTGDDVANKRSRLIAATAGAILLAGSVLAVPASAHDRGVGSADGVKELLAPFVTNGTITQAQLDAIVAARAAEATARAAKLAEFRTKAEPIIAAAHGLTLEQFRAQRDAKTLTPLTAEKRTALNTELRALATSLGLTGVPKGAGHGKFGKGKRR